MGRCHRRAAAGRRGVCVCAVVRDLAAGGRSGSGLALRSGAAVRARRAPDAAAAIDRAVALLLVDREDPGHRAGRHQMAP